jgi:hypothetical protein
MTCHCDELEKALRRVIEAGRISHTLAELRSAKWDAVDLLTKIDRDREGEEGLPF